MKYKKLLLAALITGLLTTVLCLMLYQRDNKYTVSGPQPISGILYLTEEDMRANPVCYPGRQWEFYPGVLLTPEGAASYGGYRLYTDVGGREQMGRGSGSYRLTLLLPPDEQSYALELPEVFSSCRLYINGVLTLALGNPDLENYADTTASRTVVFRAGGQAELLLAVSDLSGVYSGMTYPPAFGLADAVIGAREVRLLLHGAGVLLALLGVAMAVGFTWRGSRTRGILFLLCCLCFAIITGYPLIHGLVALPYQPWHTLEAAGLYGLLLLALLLSCNLYGLGWRAGVLISAPCAVGLLLAVVRTAGAAALPVWAGAVFSALSLLLKLYTAVCLAALSLWAAKRGRRFSGLLLSGVTALSVTLVFDRLFPQYEPIYGGWFEEVGGAVLILALAAAIWLDAMEAYHFRLTYVEELQQMEGRLARQKEHYHQISEQVMLARQSAHDLRHHMRVLREMTERGSTEQVIQYLDSYEPHLREREITVYSDHLAADAVLRYYVSAAKEAGAGCDVRFAVPPDLPFPDDELCVLLGNLLENAVEAIRRQKEGRRRLYLRGDSSNGRLRLTMENSFDGEILMQHGQYRSTKSGGMGLGLRSVRTLAEKYGGLSDFTADRFVFHSSVMIPLEP